MHLPHLPRGQRVDDPPVPEQKTQYRLAIMLRRYPVQVALALALVVVAIPVYMLVNSNSDLRKTNKELRGSTHRLRAALKDTQDAFRVTQANRKATTLSFCKVINTNAAALNTQSRYIQGLIVGGVRSSKAFERTFKSLGLPPYKERLRQAIKQANGLKKLELPPLKCKELAAAIQVEIDSSGD